MESELANTDYQIQMQQESLEEKNAEMKKIKHQIDQVRSLQGCRLIFRILTWTLIPVRDKYIKILSLQKRKVWPLC